MSPSASVSTGIKNLLAGRITGADGAARCLPGADRHYVYVLCRADGTPFYVGKGVGRRVFSHEAEARTTRRLTHKLNVIRYCHRRAEPIGYCIESRFAEERDAHQRERDLITLFGRHDLKLGPLTNQTDGGEGASNPSEESRERRRQNLYGDEADNEERQVANRFFQAILTVKSVPIKPVSALRPIEALYANRAKFAPSPRQAAALAASAIANRILLAPGAIVPRRMVIDGVDMAIENGAGRDILSSGMATLKDTTLGHETLLVSQAGYRYLLAAIDHGLLIDAGILTPEEGR